MRRAAKVAAKLLAYAGAAIALLLVATIASCYGSAWLNEREWEASKHRIRPDELEIFDVVVEAYPEDPTEAVFTGKVRNNASQFVLADIDATAVFVQCDAGGECGYVSTWGGRSLGAGWRLRPGKTAEFKFNASISDERPKPGGRLTARITVTGTRGVEP